MNSTEQIVRRAMRTLAEEVPRGVDFNPRKPTSGLRGAALPALAAAVAVLVVVAVFLVRHELQTVENAPASDPTKNMTLHELWSNDHWGLTVDFDVTSETPARLTATTLDKGVVAWNPEGYVWDPTLPDPDSGFEYVDVMQGKTVNVDFNFKPRCDSTTDWDHLMVNVEADTGPFHQQVPTPGLADAVEKWCALPMDVQTGSAHGSADLCEVRTDYEFNNPRGQAATVTVDTPGWQGDPLVLEDGDYQGTMVIHSTDACHLLHQKTEFTVQYDDGSTAQVVGPDPRENLE